MITHSEVIPGGFQFSSVWKAGTVFNLNLKLQDVNGDIDEKDVSWTMDQDYLPHEVLKALVAAVDPAFGWDASSFGMFLKITPTNPNNVGKVTINVREA